jgi:hypothetical protein
MANPQTGGRATRLNTEPSTPRPANRQQPQPAADGTWGTRDVAFFCKVSPGSVRKWIRLGLLRVDENRRVPDAVLREVLQHGLPPNRQETPSAVPIPDLAASLHPEWVAEVA